MAKNGSLFLWHLKLQGKVIFSKNAVVEEVFSSLKQYDNYQQDLNYYGELLEDVIISMKKRGMLSEFDSVSSFYHCEKYVYVVMLPRGNT